MSHKLHTTKADVPHFAIPFHYLGGKPIVNEQDSFDDVFDCVEAVLRYPKGQRDDEPDFGITPLEFSSPYPDLDRLTQEVAELEPRLEIETEILDILEEMASHIAVRVADTND